MTHRRKYTPTPGTERCPLCREMNTDDHVPHPWTDVVAAAWRSGWRQRTAITAALVALLVALANVIALLRAALGGLLP